MLEENKRLKLKISQIEECQKKTANCDRVTPSNTSQRTQATDWFLAKEESFSVSSCSSTDSIMILNDQVKQIKELKQMSGLAKNHNHQISTSINNENNIEVFFREIRRKISFGSWGSIYKAPESMEKAAISMRKINGKKNFLSAVLMADLPAIRF